MNEVRARLPEGVGRDEVDAAAERLDWRLVDVHPPSGDRPRRVFFATGDGEGWVTLVEDARLGTAHLEVAGHDPEALLALALENLGDPLRERTVSSPVDLPGDKPVPHRPRLARSVHCGRHVEDGVSRVILVDVGAGVRVEIDESRYLVLTFCDGSRDLDGLCLAAAQEGIYGGEAGIRVFLEELHGLGLLRDGLPIPQPAPPVASEAASPERPLVFLPDYGFECDGRGSCCRFYGMVAFDPKEAREADALAPRMNLPLAPPDLFTPFSGAQVRDGAPRVVAQARGRCLFLEDDAGCGLHRIGGTYAKPFPCRTFPTTLVDDGTEVRVSVAPECACVYRSLDSEAGDRLLPQSAVTLGDIPAAPWRTVPEPVPLTRRNIGTRAQLRSWSDALMATLPDVDDVPSFLFSVASQLPETFSEPARLRDWRSHSATVDEEVDRHLEALAVRARQAAEQHRHTYPAGALATRVANWMADALHGATAATLSTLPHDVRHERFYVRSLAFAHRLAPPGNRLREGLIDRGVRLLAARALERAPLDDDAAQPALALLEAAMRNLSLAGYAARVAV